MYTPFDDVTSKIAYAYAKQQAFVALAGMVLVGASAAALGELRAPVFLLANLLILVAAAGALAIIVRRRDLGAINRPCLRLFAAALAGRLALETVGLYFGEAPIAGGAADLGVDLLLAAGTISYVFPLRRGSTVLYRSAEVRELANDRTVALASVALAMLDLGRLIGPIRSGTLAAFDGFGLLLAASVALAVGAAVLGVRPTGRSAGRRLAEGVLALATALTVAAAVVASAPIEGALLAADPLGVLLVALGVVHGASERLNRGKTIVARRG